jgi:hypothetical protein
MAGFKDLQQVAQAVMARCCRAGSFLSRPLI